MKKIVSLFSILTFVLVIASCTKNPAKVLPKKDGKWNYTYTDTDAKGKTETGSGTMVFTESAVTLTDNSTSFAFSGTWSYDKGSENITLTILGDATVYKVTDMTRKSETWTNTDNNSISVIKLTKP